MVANFAQVGEIKTAMRVKHQVVGAAQADAEAALEQATLAYRQVVLTAFQEVEDNLVAASQLQEQAQALSESLVAAQRNLTLTQEQYKAGTVSYLNVVQAQTTDMLSGMACLMLSGFVQSLCMTPLAAAMLRATEPAYRGRVMGIRILGILGLPLGLMLAGPLIQQWGFQITMTAYAICGILLTLAMALYWRQVLWLDDKPI